MLMLSSALLRKVTFFGSIYAGGHYAFSIIKKKKKIGGGGGSCILPFLTSQSNIAVWFQIKQFCCYLDCDLHWRKNNKGGRGGKGRGSGYRFISGRRSSMTFYSIDQHILIIIQQ